MSPVLVSLIVFACVYGGALAGFALHVPQHHRDGDSRDVLKASSALIGTMSALVLGLLVASAKSSYDNQREELVQICADVALLDRALAAYGPEAAETRRLLKTTIEAGFVQLWQPASEPPSASGEAFYDSIERLPAASERQRAIKALTGQLAIGLGRTRWLMHAQSASSVSTPLLVIVVFWLAILFVSFGVYAKPNATVHVALFVCALSVAGAIFLILEMDRPFDGLIQISDTPIRDIVDRLGR
jgi:hypothetical protein